MGLTGLELLALAFAVVLAHAFYARTLIYPSDFDAKAYLDIAADIARNGVLSKFDGSEARPYGYPLFLRLLEPLATALDLSWKLVVFEVQLALFVGAVLFVRARLLRVSRQVAVGAAIALLLNPIALVYVADTLTEALSLVLLLAAAGCWIGLFADGTRKLLPLAAGSAAIGIALVVRPANAFAIPAWLLAMCAVIWLQRWPLRGIVAGAATTMLAVGAPLVPQVANNVRHYEALTPLIAFDLYKQQQVWGIQNLKYATALPPVPQFAIHYANPFLSGRPVDIARPLTWYLQHPVPGVATLGLHVFGMIDQDLVFPYARDLDPWYRLPLGVATHGVVFLALAGLCMLGRRARHDRNARVAFIALVAAIGCHIGVHTTTAVEMRFGLPLVALEARLPPGASPSAVTRRPAHVER